jgi:hypothetical protein
MIVPSLWITKRRRIGRLEYAASRSRLECDALAKYAFELSTFRAPGATRLIPCVRSCRLLTGDTIDTLAAAAIYAVFNAWSLRVRDGIRLLSVTL